MTELIEKLDPSTVDAAAEMPVSSELYASVLRLLYATPAVWAANQHLSTDFFMQPEKLRMLHYLDALEKHLGQSEEILQIRTQLENLRYDRRRKTSPEFVPYPGSAVADK